MEELWLIWSKDNQGIAHDYFVCFEGLQWKELGIKFVIAFHFAMKQFTRLNELK